MLCGHKNITPTGARTTAARLLVNEVPKDVDVAVSPRVCRKDVVVRDDHHAFRIPNLWFGKGTIVYRYGDAVVTHIATNTKRAVRGNAWAVQIRKATITVLWFALDKN